MTIKKQKWITFILIFFYALSTSAQNQKVSINIGASSSKSAKDQSVRSPIQYQALSNSIDTSKTAKWNKKLVCFEKKHESVPAFEKIKREKTAQKLANKQTSNSNSEPKSSMVPNIELGFATGGYTGYAPPDNTMAISKDGIIVTAVNSKLEYYDTVGNVLYSATFDDFFNDTNLNSISYDPIIQYDSDSDRFVVVVLHGFQSSTSKVICCFSKTNNPLDGWWSYYLTGNPLSDSSWFDYPNLGISNDEIFVTGNIFTDGFDNNESVIYQIDKANAYNGDTLAWAYWHGISGHPFTIVPANYGQDGNYGPGIYLISTFSFDDTVNMVPYLRVYDITGNLNDTASINMYSQVLPFGISGNAMQKGTSLLLDNGDPRGQDAFYLDGILHFVYGSEYSNGFSGLNYNRLNLSTMSNWHSIYGVPNFDCNYPSLVSSGVSQSDKSVYICYLTSGATIFPESRAITCNDLGQWSGSSLMKEGETFSAFVAANGVSRWGDYTDICARYNASQTEIWANGCFGKFHTNQFSSYYYLDSWISKINGLTVGIPANNNIITSTSKVYPNPFTDMFSLEFSNDKDQRIKISLTDISGKEIKLLYNDISRKGKNLFTFNRQALSQGIYFMVIENDTEKIAVEKLIVQ